MTYAEFILCEVSKQKLNFFQPLGDILAQDDILDHFEGIELLSSGSGWQTINCHLALTRTYIHVFHESGRVMLITEPFCHISLTVRTNKKALGIFLSLQTFGRCFLSEI